MGLSALVEPKAITHLSAAIKSRNTTSGLGSGIGRDSNDTAMLTKQGVQNNSRGTGDTFLEISTIHSYEKNVDGKEQDQQNAHIAHPPHGMRSSKQKNRSRPPLRATREIEAGIAC